MRKNARVEWTYFIKFYSPKFGFNLYTQSFNRQFIRRPVAVYSIDIIITNWYNGIEWRTLNWRNALWKWLTWSTFIFRAQEFDSVYFRSTLFRKKNNGITHRNDIHRSIACLLLHNHYLFRLDARGLTADRTILHTPRRDTLESVAWPAWRLHLDRYWILSTVPCLVRVIRRRTRWLYSCWFV